MKQRKTTTRAGAIALVAALTMASPLSVLAADGDPYVRTYNSTGSVEFTASEDVITKPVDPTDPGKEVTPVDPDGNPAEPGTTGPLSVDFASTLYFGKNKISSSDETYYADPQTIWIDTNADGVVDSGETDTRPNYVQVTDNRGKNAGWTLTVTQQAQLTSTTTTQNSVLTGAEIKLTNGTTSTNMKNVTAPTTSDITLKPGAASPVMSAAVGAGSGTWIDYFGTLADVEVEGTTVEKNTAVTLSVPGSTPKDAVVYSATLVWSLSDTPGN